MKEAAPRDTTQTLIARARDGDARAKDALFGRHLNRVLYFARRKLDPRLRDRMESMDLVQDALAVASRKFEEFDPNHSGAFMGWLRRCVEFKLNEARKFHYRSARDLAREADAGPADDPAGERASDRVAALEGMSSLHMATLIDRQAAVERLEAILGSLAPDQREMVELWYLEGLTPKEMAERTGKTADACRMMVNRGLHRLGREYFEERSDDAE